MRVATVIGMPEANATEYEELHAHVWPEVLASLKRSGIANYSIFRHEELLFSYYEYEGSDPEADTALAELDPIVQQWQAICGALQRTLTPNAEEGTWTAVPEIFHLE